MTAEEIARGLSPDEQTALYYMQGANKMGLGLYSPSLRSFGTEPICEGLVRKDLCVRRRGYWLTPLGLAVRHHLTGTPPRG